VTLAGPVGSEYDIERLPLAHLLAPVFLEDARSITDNH
jgi:hypothetical protein